MHYAVLLVCLLVSLLCADSVLASHRAHPAKPRTVGHHFRKRDHPKRDIHNPLIASRQVKAADIRKGQKYARDCPGPVVSGSCNCPTGETSCSGTCVDLTSDPNNCAFCGYVCADVLDGSQCSDSSCQCLYPEDYCGGSSCTDISTDGNNCGACGVLCGDAATCQAGSCVCDAPYSDCGLLPFTCIDLTASPSNCGACGNVCLDGAICESGSCQCTAFDNDYCDDTCTNIASDDSNCGSCGIVCDANSSCIDASCECDSGFSTCPGLVCADLLTDPNNCGVCENACNDGIGVSACEGGSCVCTDAPTYQYCDSACTDTLTDPLNCGSCGNNCSPCMSCTGGTCDECP